MKVGGGWRTSSAESAPIAGFPQIVAWREFLRAPESAPVHLPHLIWPTNSTVGCFAVFHRDSDALSAPVLVCFFRSVVQSRISLFHRTVEQPFGLDHRFGRTISVHAEVSKHERGPFALRYLRANGNTSGGGRNDDQGQLFTFQADFVGRPSGPGSSVFSHRV